MSWSNLSWVDNAHRLRDVDGTRASVAGSLLDEFVVSVNNGSFPPRKAEGDTLVNTTLDRLGRSTQNMLVFAVGYALKARACAS